MYIKLSCFVCDRYCYPTKRVNVMFVNIL